jgi:sarcosine oxidase subunit alpha
MSQQHSTVARGQGRMRLEPQPAEVIDRSRALHFTWNGTDYTGHPGDTIMSALAAHGESVFARSFKYHRPRGILTASFHDPNCMVQVGSEPNVRGSHRLLEDGMQVTSQNTWPSLGFDVKAVNRFGARFMSAGFYYKTFMKPEFLWPTYEKVLRRFVHAGAISPDTPHRYHDKRYAHPDVLVAGGGPAGISAAIAAAREGANVMLVEEEHQLGGHLRWEDPARLSLMLSELGATERVEVLTNSVVLGRYDQNWIAVAQRNLPHVPERLIKARARTLVVAGGLIERPYVFAGNDTPGVMLSTAVRRLINLYAVKPGHRAVVLTANASGDAAVEDLRRAGVDVVHVEDARTGGDLLRVHGGRRVKSVELADGRRVRADLLVTATGWTAPTSLLNMAGDIPVYDPRAARFLPGGSGSSDVMAVGGLAGDGTLDQLREHAEAVGTAAARRAERARNTDLQAMPTRGAHRPATPEVEEKPIPALPIHAHPELFRSGTHGIVDYSEDVSSKDLHSAVKEGYDSAELAKRYTTATMGPLQGKLEVMNTIACIAEATGSTIAETGTTTWRPMYVPVSLGALAGRIFEPVRYSPMQPWHEQHNAKPLVAGQWIRPEHYGDPAAEIRAVREGVGIIDVTPIGKLDLRGPDASKLLNLLYVNKWSKLAIGGVRYGVMCAEDGVVMDDGVTGRLAEDHYLMSTTSSGAASVWEWVENWLQTEHPDWQVHVTPVTTAYASINVAGPRSRELVSRLSEGVDLSTDAFGYMQVRTGRVAGVDDCVLWRIGFTGELSYELHVPASYGLHVWESLLEHGEDLGVRPFGIEAQRTLRLEKGHLIVGQDTDGLTKAYSAGLDWAVKLDKDDFVGKPELVWQHERRDGARLVAVQPDDAQIVPPEASQIISTDGRILGRITSSRMSPTLNRAICLGQVEASVSEPGTRLTVRLPDRRNITARVMEHLAHVDPENTRQNIDTPVSELRPHHAPVARSPIGQEGTVVSVADWQVSARHSEGSLTLADLTPLAKIGIRSSHDGALMSTLGTGFGRATLGSDGNLVVGSGPGEWLVLGDPGSQDKLLTKCQRLSTECGEFASVVDLTHGRAMLRIAGERSVELLAKVCAIDLGDDFVPDGAAFRTSVAKLVTDVVRVDRDGVRSYFLHCERSSGQFLFDALLDAGNEFGIEIDGCPTSPTF